MTMKISIPSPAHEVRSASLAQYATAILLQRDASVTDIVGINRSALPDLVTRALDEEHGRITDRSASRLTLPGLTSDSDLPGSRPQHFAQLVRAIASQ